MALRDDDLDDATTDVESDAGHFLSAEDTPLLPTDLPPDVIPDKSFQHLVLAMTMLFLMIIEMSVYLMDAPSMAIMEDIICREKHPDHILFPDSHVSDIRCKEPGVQKYLALVKGWLFSSEMFVPLLVQIPFGILADRIGRRPVLFMSLLGCVLQSTWKMFVLYFHNVFPVWTVTLGSVAFLLGGGGQMAGAMLWTIISDVSPAAERTRNFYLFRAATLALSVIIKPLAAFLMSWDPWIDMWLGLVAGLVGTGLALLIPETGKLRQTADRKHPPDESAEDATAPGDGPASGATTDNTLLVAWTTTRDAAKHMWHFIFASKHIMWLLACLSMVFPVDQACSVYLLQYMTKRYDWSWSKAAYVSNINDFTALIVLLGLLPLASSLLTSRGGLGILSRDLFLARVSIMFYAAGVALMAFAAAPWIIVVSLVVYNFGIGYAMLCRALLIAIVEPHTVATLNTTISTVESVVGLLGVPAVGWLLAVGFETGGVLVGLPYMVSFGVIVAVTVVLFLWRVPRGFEHGRSS